MYGYLSARDLQCALDAQSAMRDKQVDVDTAIRCLKIAIKTESPFADVLHEQTGLGQARMPTDKLGQLLYEAGIVSLEQLSLAMQRSLSTGLPLGHMLGLDNVVSDSLLSAALEIQGKLRDEMMSRPEAIKQLRDAAGTAVEGKPVPEGDAGIVFQQPRKRGIRLGEMMVLSGLMTEADVMNALEWGLIHNQPIGHVLAKKAGVKQEVIDAALALQQLADQNKIESMRACECLAKVAALGITVDEALKEMEAVASQEVAHVLSYRTLLTLSRVMSDEDFENAIDLNSKGAQVIGKFLAATGYMDGPTVRATLKCHYLLSKGLMTQDDAVATLDYCLHHRPGKTVDYDAALNELGWSSKSPLKLAGEIQGPQNLISSSREGLKAAGTKSGDGIPHLTGKFTQTISPADTNASKIHQMLTERTEGALTQTVPGAEVADDALVSTFTRLAQSYSEQGNYVQAQIVYERLLVDRLNKLGPNDSALVDHLKNLAGVLCCQGKFNQSEPFMRRTISILEATRGAADPELADCLSILAGIYYRQEKFADAEPLAQRVVRLREGQSQGGNMELVDALYDQAKVLRKLGRVTDAERVYARGKSLQTKLAVEAKS
jgi:tetratricopeptide (TPR) repeat protein